MGPRVVDREKKAAEIARAALPVFCEMGYANARMADIAERAGVGKGTLYEYFSNKEEILRHELDRYFADFERGAGTVLAAAETAWERLTALVRFSVEHVEQWQDHCTVFFDALGSARVAERGREWFEEMFERFHGLLAALVRDGQERGELRTDMEPEVAAELILSLYEGYLMLGIFGVRCCEARRFERGVLQLLERGIRS